MRRQATTHRVQGQVIPGWGMLLIGLIIGLFIAFLVYLDRLDATPVAKQQAEETGKPAVKPRFEFYSILPELEIVVPDILDSVVPDRSTQEGTDDGDATVYFLQAGSFKNGDEADRMKATLSLLGLDVVIQSVTVNDVEWHRVRVGPLQTAQALRAARDRLRQNDIEFMLLKTGR